MKKKTARRILWLAVLALAAGCSQRYELVRLEIPEKASISLDGYDRVCFVDFALTFSEPGYDPQPQIRKYFTEELPVYIAKPITMLTMPVANLSAGVSVANTWDNNLPRQTLLLWQRLFGLQPQTLVITGSGAITVKNTSIIRETRDTLGRRRGGFVTQQFWNADLKMQLIDAGTWKVVFEEKQTEKFSAESESPAQFNISSQLNKLGEKLILALQKRKRFQERYLLLK